MDPLYPPLVADHHQGLSPPSRGRCCLNLVQLPARKKNSKECDVIIGIFPPIGQRPVWLVGGDLPQKVMSPEDPSSPTMHSAPLTCCRSAGESTVLIGWFMTQSVSLTQHAPLSLSLSLTGCLALIGCLTQTVNTGGRSFNISFYSFIPRR